MLAAEADQVLTSATVAADTSACFVCVFLAHRRTPGHIVACTFHRRFPKQTNSYLLQDT